MPHIVFAYLDPGTGSYVLQLALAGTLGAVDTAKHYWTRLKSLFRRTDTVADRARD